MESPQQEHSPEGDADDEEGEESLVLDQLPGGVLNLEVLLRTELAVQKHLDARDGAGRRLEGGLFPLRRRVSAFELEAVYSVEGLFLAFTAFLVVIVLVVGLEDGLGEGHLVHLGSP